MVTYIAIFFHLTEENTQLIKTFGQEKLLSVELENTTILKFVSELNLDEMTSKLNDMEALYILGEYNDLYFGLPDYVIEYLEKGFVNVAEKLNMEFDTKQEYEDFLKSNKKTKVDEIDSEIKNYFDVIIYEEIMTPIEFIKTKSVENKAQLSKMLETKLPNVTEWEADVLNLLLNEL